MKKIRYLEGYISGTNRGQALARLVEEEKELEATAIIKDQTFGISIVNLTGTVSDGQSELRIMKYRSLVPFNPLDGEMKINFHEDSGKAVGTWKTEIGTQGGVAFRSLNIKGINWWIKLIFSYLKLFFLQNIPYFYILALIIITLLSVIGLSKVSYSSLILLLAPLPFIFKKQIMQLIQIFRLRKAGPFEFETQKPLILSDIQRFIDTMVEEKTRFFYLDAFFVPKTKAILTLLARSGPSTFEQFNHIANILGIPPDNILVTWSVIISSRCAKTEGDKLEITPFGMKYVNHLYDQLKISVT